MQATIIKTIDPEITVKDDKEQVIEATMSTERIDRDGENISVAGWDLTDFKKQPRLVSSHDYGGGFLGAGAGLLKQIGKWKNTRKDHTIPALKGQPVYYTRQFREREGIDVPNVEADWGYFLAKMGQATYSVGFIPSKTTDHADGDGIKIPFRTYEKQSLLETSHVIIPSNADAMGVLRSKGHQVHPNIRRSVAAIMQEVADGKATYLEDYQDVIIAGLEEQAKERTESNWVEFTLEEKELLLQASGLFVRYAKANPAKFASAQYGDDGADELITDEKDVPPEVVHELMSKALADTFS